MDGAVAWFLPQSTHNTSRAQNPAHADNHFAVLRSMFPINADAPRLSDPSKRSAAGFYTPYFQTFTFDGLFRAGRANFILAQYRQAWGWALTQASTWLEVFDPRWEVVHSWGGCPTWQLSQYVLGLSPRLDVGARHFELAVHAGSSLHDAAGVVLCRDGRDDVHVSWVRVATATLEEDDIAISDAADSISYTLTAETPVFVLGWPTEPTAWTRLSGSCTITLVSPT